MSSIAGFALGQIEGPHLHWPFPRDTRRQLRRFGVA